MNRRSFIEKAGIFVGAIASPFRLGPLRWSKLNWGRFLAWKMSRTRGLVIYPKVHDKMPVDPGFIERANQHRQYYKRIAIMYIRKK